MEETTGIANLKKRSVISAVSLFVQSGYSSFLGLMANLVLTILLSPTVFGIYITVLSIIALFNYFADFGLAASLIQKKDINRTDLTTSFTTQQLLILCLVAIGWTASSFIKGFYKLPQEGVYLYWALLGGFFVSSLKTIPSILLERKIQFQKIVIVEIIEDTLFYTTAVVLALSKFGLMSFTIAVIIRSVVGLIAIYILSPWMPGFGISLSALKELMSFGVPFQAASFLAIFKDDLITLYLSKILGFELLGYIGWAKKWAEAPLRIVMDNVTRVLFPVVSRIQQDKEKVSNIMNKIITYQTHLIAPALAGAAFVLPLLVVTIPKYSKWSPALPVFFIFLLSSFLVTFSSPFINLFNALGRVKLSLGFMAFWTVLMWVLTPLFTRMWGFYGFPIAHLSLSLTFVFVIIYAKKMINLSLISSVVPSLVSVGGMAAVIGVILLFLKPSFTTIAVIIAAGAISYYALLKFLFKIDLIVEVKSLLGRE